MSLPTVEGFSLSHAAILDGDTGAEEVDGDIYGVDEASLDPDSDSFDNTGDDAVLSTWSWLNFATVNVRGGYIPFKLLSLLTGETLESSGADPDDQFSINIWTDRAFNQPPRPMLIRIPARDAAGAVRFLEFVLYKVQFEPITFDGPTYKDGLKVNYTGRALLSETDEQGNALAGFKAVGRLVDRAAT